MTIKAVTTVVFFSLVCVYLMAQVAKADLSYTSHSKLQTIVVGIRG